MSGKTPKAMKVVGKMLKNRPQEVKAPPVLSTKILAGMASPAPPLGPSLGQRGINVAQFCKDFNSKTEDFIEGTPLPSRVTVNPDRSYNLEIETPSTTWLVMRAAGIRIGKTQVGEVAGMITLKHVYEIALVKGKDPINFMYSMRELCEQVIQASLSIGVQVVHDYDPTEYRGFLEERKERITKELQAIEEKKAAKLLRTGTV